MMDYRKMIKGRMYTIRYARGENVDDFDGCRFEAIGYFGFPDGEPDLGKEFVTAYRQDSAPIPLLFDVSNIVEIIEEVG